MTTETHRINLEGRSGSVTIDWTCGAISVKWEDGETRAWSPEQVKAAIGAHK